ncbi:MAG TPA: hypothetical protein VHM02_00940 [Thermoanaerobaculia bacterium]|nr:hypothetical protein [Thermoanaerobaculia bacterium]
MSECARPLSLAAALLFAVLALPALAAPPAVRFEERAAVVEGLEPDGEVVVVAVARGVAGFLPYHLTIAERRTADAAGTARVELEQELPAASVWAVVDLAEGEVVLAAPPGGEVREIAFPGGGVPASLRRLEDRRESLMVLWLRPEPAEGEVSVEPVGAWAGRAFDGSARDGDERQDRRLSVRLDLLEPLGDSPPPPEEVAPGDVLVGIDTETLEVYTFRLRSAP